MTAWARAASPGAGPRLDRTERLEAQRPGLLVTSKCGQGPRFAGKPGPRDQRERRTEITCRLQPGCEPSHRCRGSGGIALRMTAATALARAVFTSFRRGAIVGTIGFAGGNRTGAAAVRAQTGNVIARR